jgi:serine/threonine protein kinase
MNDLNNAESSESDSTESLSSDDINIYQTDNLNLENNIIRDYNVIYELGRGSYSIVWLAYNINNNNFFALKVQNWKEYKIGIDEINFVKKLPLDPPYFNNLIEYFIEIRENKKYLCSVWNLHAINLDTFIKQYYQNGLPVNIIKQIMNQLLEAINILHNKFKIFHGDIKTDNILIKGINMRDEYIINEYKKHNFMYEYNKAKEHLGKNIKKEIKMEIRNKIHNNILSTIYYEKYDKYKINDNYIKNINISLADFGTFCEESKKYYTPFGTRYYQAPEIILMGNCSYGVDIWALGCTLYELLSGSILFNPIKDSTYTRDYYHLCLINDTCGEFPLSFLKLTKYNKLYFKSNNIIEHETTNDRLDRKINEMKMNRSSNNISLSEDEIIKCKNVLQNILIIDPKKRCNVEYLICHSFFKLN